MSRNVFYQAAVRTAMYAYDSPEGPVGVFNTSPIMTVAELLNLAERHHLDTIWIVPHCTLSHADPEAFCNADPFIWDIKYFKTEGTTAQLPRMKRVVAWRHHGNFEQKRTIEIHFVEQSMWNWEVSDPMVLLRALLKLHQDLAVKMNGHPGSVGRELMKWWVSREHQAVARLDYTQLPFKCARDYAWKRPLEGVDAEPGRYFLHAYDKNSMYVSAASGASLGIGDPTYYTGALTNAFRLTKAGIWRVKVTPPIMPNPGLPLGSHALDVPFPLARNQEWATTPLIKCLLEMGCFVEFIEGYQWENSKRALESWANALWKFRCLYKASSDPVDRICYGAMKRIATASIGLLGYESNVIKDVAWRRPDWWSTIIETAKARMLYNINKNAQDYHILPNMVFVDCLYYVSDSSSPDIRLLQRSNELGGYKHKGTWPVTQDIIEWFADPDKHAGAIVRDLNELEEATYAR